MRLIESVMRLITRTMTARPATRKASEKTRARAVFFLRRERAAESGSKTTMR